MGVPHEDARYFERGVREGGTLVTVVASHRGKEARDTLKQHGASLGAMRSRQQVPRIEERPSASVPVDHDLVPSISGSSGAWQGTERRMRTPGRRRSDS